MSNRVELTARCAADEAARIRAAAEKIGITTSAFLIASALERAHAEALESRIEEVVAAAMAEQKAQSADERAELAEGLGDALKSVLDEHGQRLNTALVKFSEWVQKRWPEPHVATEKQP